MPEKIQPNAATQSVTRKDLEVPDIEWVFGYGSLMWRPGFRFLDQCPARLDGYHRAPCIYSHHHRGTIDVPGLVLGLDSGGSCHGIAFKIDIKDRPQIVEYLYEREMIGYAYKPACLDIEIGHDRVTAFTFVADPDHDQYAGDLGEERAADIIMRAEGISGLNRDYLMNTVEKLEHEGFAEPDLVRLRYRVRLLTGEIDQGGGI
ncbi:MAG: gamma-glutamylcyclotransferase [Rhodospirillales bacterium]|nr:gamma-glutamylcyclotransferase [Rhodospirillales bacterium]MBO6786535.1 gamma-glutamylcyclotransferase [Rhodospirillales bacterium]